MDNISEIGEALKHLKDSQNALSKIKEDYKSNKLLYDFYVPSSEYLVTRLKQHVDALLREYIGGFEPEPDMWIRIEGPDFKSGRAPLTLVSTFIKKLVLANQHAVSLLSEVKYDGQRINKKIKHLAELDLVATAPGSLKLGVKKPSLDYFINVNNPEQEHIDQNDFIKKTILEAEKDSERSIEGLKLLVRAISASDEASELQKLMDEFENKKDILKLLYYAREITPTQLSGIESVTFSGNFLPANKTKEIIATKKTRLGLKELSDKIIEHEQYIEGVGTVREIDLDKMSFRIDSLRFDSKIYDNIECTVEREDYTEVDLKQLMDREIHLMGILTYTDTGEIKLLEVDKLFPTNFLDEE